MIVLVTNGDSQLEMLGWMLAKSELPYEVTFDNKYGFETPFLVVNNIPLSYEKSLVYLQEQMKHE
jgi:hypothetical protein